MKHCIRQIQQAAFENIPFHEPYQFIFDLIFHYAHIQKLKNNNMLSQALWKKNIIISSFLLAACSKKERNLYPGLDKFIENKKINFYKMDMMAQYQLIGDYLAQHQAYLPQPNQFQTENESDFPKPTINSLNGWEGHQFGNRIVCKAPDISATRNANSFLNIMFHNSVKHIIMFAGEENYIHSLHQGKCKDFILLSEKKILIENEYVGLKLTVINKNSKHLYNFNHYYHPVADEQAITFNYIGLRTILSIYQQTDHQSRCTLHCISGVNRSGSINTLFALLDEIRVNKTFHILLTKFITKEDLSARECRQLGHLFRDILSRVRKVRMAVTSSVQYTAIIKNTILLHTLQQGHPEFIINRLAIKINHMRHTHFKKIKLFGTNKQKIQKLTDKISPLTQKLVN